MALHSNTGGTVQKMADAIWASFLHVSSNEKHQYHSLCNASWCQYQRDQVNKTNLFKHGPGLPNDILAHVKPIYRDLIKHEELKKCLHGKTQNQNESFNSLIWERAPKSLYLSIDKIRFAVYDAVAVFNDGRQGSLNVLRNVGINPGYYTTETCCLLNMKRRMNASNELNEATRKRRQCFVLKKRRRPKRNVRKENHIKLVDSNCCTCFYATHIHLLCKQLFCSFFLSLCVVLRKFRAIFAYFSYIWCISGVIFSEPLVQAT